MEEEINPRTRKFQREPTETAQSLVEIQNLLAFHNFQIEREGTDAQPDPGAILPQRRIAEVRIHWRPSDSAMSK